MTAKPVPEHISDDLTALERLRLHVHDHEIFPFSTEDAEEILEEYEVALTELQHRREAEAGSNLQKVQSADPVADAGEMVAPDGWVLVPREPTEAMLSAAQDANYSAMAKGASGLGFKGVYRTMLAASPSSPASGVEWCQACGSPLWGGSCPTCNNLNDLSAALGEHP